MIQIEVECRNMAGMQRFVTYIYAYENGQKNRNAGYAKIEIKGNNGRMDIHFVSGGVTDGLGKVFFLYIKERKVVSIPLGELLVEGGRGTGQFLFHTGMLQDMKLAFEQIDGIGITDSDHQTYMSFWKDVDLPEEEAFTEMETRVEPQQEEPVGDIEPTQKEIMEEAEQESLHTMEIPMRNIFPNYTMEDIWHNMERNQTCVQINEEVCAVQIELSDLRELPKKYWYLGNNSFLLHGFFNYHHLLFGKLPNGKWFLGVPGVYERQERVIASVFGFPGFIPVDETQQGIWYHILED